MYKRIHFQELIKRLNEPKRFIQVITGPHQVGKTTLVQHKFINRNNHFKRYIINRTHQQTNFIKKSV